MESDKNFWVNEKNMYFTREKEKVISKSELNTYRKLIPMFYKHSRKTGEIISLNRLKDEIRYIITNIYLVHCPTISDNTLIKAAVELGYETRTEGLNIYFEIKMIDTIDNVIMIDNCTHVLLKSGH